MFKTVLGIIYDFLRSMSNIEKYLISWYIGIKILKENRMSRKRPIGSTRDTNRDDVQIIIIVQVIFCCIMLGVGLYYTFAILEETRDINILDWFLTDRYYIIFIVYACLVITLFFISLDGNLVKEKALKSIARFFQV